eukprot:3027768-Amphidinium_carterae.1
MLQEDAVKRSYLRTLVVVLDHQLSISGLSVAKFRVPMRLCCVGSQRDFVFSGRGIVYMKSGDDQIVVVDARAESFTQRM